MEPLTVTEPAPREGVDQRVLDALTVGSLVMARYQFDTPRLRTAPPQRVDLTVVGIVRSVGDGMLTLRCRSGLTATIPLRFVTAATPV